VVIRLRPQVLEELARHGLTMGPDDTAESLREHLNELYVADVRRLKAQEVAGEIRLRDYARRVEALREGYPLLGLPLSLWTE
jgi:hypothetical protein